MDSARRTSPLRRSEVRGGLAGRGFTLIELMVVVAIIAVLVTVTVPAIKAISEAGQLAQAENILRATLIQARAQALRRGLITGVRMQDDGRLIIVYAANQGQTYSPDNFANTPVYQMQAIPGLEPQEIPFPFRVAAFEYTLNTMWRTTENWWKGQRWYATCVAMFSPRGRGMQAKCTFPNSPAWYPTLDGSFGQWTTGQGVIYSYQGNVGLAYDSGGSIVAVTEVTGPSVTTQFRLYNYGRVRGQLEQGQMIKVVVQGRSGYGGGATTYILWDSDAKIDEAMIAMSNTAADLMLDVNTGFLIRHRAETAALNN